MDDDASGTLAFVDAAGRSGVGVGSGASVGTTGVWTAIQDAKEHVKAISKDTRPNHWASLLFRMCTLPFSATARYSAGKAEA
jgi:hypothetical protein